MKQSKPIFLSEDMVVNIDGKEFKVKDLKEHVIDSVLYRKYLKELMGAFS